MKTSSATRLAILLLGGAAFSGDLAFGSGFSITAQGTNQLGSAFSAQAAAEEPSTVWYNPAGMLGLDGTRVAMVTNVIKPSFRYRDRGSTGAFALSSDNGGDAGGVAVVPQIYATRRVNDKLSVGVAVNPPYGLQTEYRDGWRGQLLALTSKAKSININPAIAYRMTDRLWLGAGVSWQNFEATLTNFAGPAGNARLEASDSSIGFNVGVLYSTPGNVRLGLAFRSNVSYVLGGDAKFTAGSGALHSGARARLTVPETISASVLVPVGDSWEWTANTTLTRWSRVRELNVIRTTASALGAAGSTIAVLPFDWRDAWFIAAGGARKLSPTWKLKFGAAIDPRVSNDASRTPRLPDQKRLLFTVGASHELHSGSTIDLAYGHEIIDDASVGNTVAGAGTLNGRFKNTADVVSFQYNYRF